ncbi:flagellar hook-basal body protein [Peptococcaceae bacterium 1198_IL3148]
MLKTVQSGAAALKIQELQMATVGNNVANINTVGYKADKPMTDFSEAVRQALSDSGTTTKADAKITPAVGSGMRVIMMTKKDFGQGTLQETGRSLDLAIDGHGFFVLADPYDGSTVYSRAGDFEVDKDGKLVNPAGFSMPDITVPPGTQELKIERDGRVIAVPYQGEKQEIGQIKLQYFENPSYLTPLGKNVYAANENVTVLKNPEVPGIIRQGFLEQSNVDFVDEMARMITAQKAHSFGSRSITTADEMWEMSNNLTK